MIEMDDQRRRRREAERLVRAKCNRILRIITANARHQGLTGDELEDCVRWFLARELKQGLGDGPCSEQQWETIKRQAATFAKRCAIRLTRRSRRSVEIVGEDGSMENGPAGQLASKEPGPEEQAIEAELLRRILLHLSEMTPDQRHLYVRRFLDEMRLSDLQEETGRTANALGVFR